MSSMEYMRDLLDNLDALKPKATAMQPLINKKVSIRACVFDIYGTLLISSSGDIDLSDISDDYLARAFYHGGVDITLDEGCSGGFCNRVIQQLEKTVKKHHQKAQQNGTQYPEVNILEIWQEVLDQLEKNREIIKKEHYNIKKITGLFEILSNRIFPMPGMKELIVQLAQRKIPMGIISNAQFYTPVIMNYFLSSTLPEEEIIQYIDPDLTVFSYKEGRAKPDISLFEKIKPRLRQLGIADEETLFVGNDMLKDIYAAHKAGFKTALFAGDKRSLRMREDKEEVKNIQPDFIITELNQIAEII